MDETVIFWLGFMAGGFSGAALAFLGLTAGRWHYNRTQKARALPYRDKLWRRDTTEPGERT
jgi:hypothetical protein